MSITVGKGQHCIICAIFLSVQLMKLSSANCGERGWEVLLLAFSGCDGLGQVWCGCHSSLSSWRLTTAAIGGGREILVGSSCRTIRGWYCDESMPRVPSFEAIDSRRCREAIAVHMMLLGHQGGSVSAVEVVMVTMTF